MNLALKYIIFAIFSIIINLSSQHISFLLYDGKFSLYIAMLIGTFSGLFSKYILDKKYIFYYQTKSKKDDGMKFILYSLMGIFTTFIFWIFEVGFYIIFENKNAKYLGALIGLFIGYATKYFLDKNFVFRRKYELK